MTVTVTFEFNDEERRALAHTLFNHDTPANRTEIENWIQHAVAVEVEDLVADLQNNDVEQAFDRAITAAKEEYAKESGLTEFRWNAVAWTVVKDTNTLRRHLRRVADAVASMALAFKQRSTEPTFTYPVDQGDWSAVVVANCPLDKWQQDAMAMWHSKSYGRLEANS